MCEGMAIANVLQNVTCPKKNDSVTEAEHLLPGEPSVNDHVSQNFCLRLSVLKFLLFTLVANLTF